MTTHKNFGYGLKIAKESCTLVAQHKKSIIYLLIPELVDIVFLLIINNIFAWIRSGITRQTGVFDKVALYTYDVLSWAHNAPNFLQTTSYALAKIVYWFISFLLACGLIHYIHSYLISYQRHSFKTNLKHGLRSWKACLAWAFITGLIFGLFHISQFILPLAISSLITIIGSVVWFFCTYFVLPIIALTNHSLIKAIKKSAHLVKYLWKPIISGQGYLILIFAVLSAPFFLSHIVITYITGFQHAYIATAFILIFRLLGIIFSTLTLTLRTVFFTRHQS